MAAASSRNQIIAEFNKLQQLDSSVHEYTLKFEALRPTMSSILRNGATEEYFVASYISGLNKDLQSFVSPYRPQNLQHAIHLATKRDQIVANNKKRLTMLNKHEYRFKAVYAGWHELHFAVSTGSNFSFLDEETAVSLGCFTEPMPRPMELEIVGSGMKTMASRIATGFTWSMGEGEEERVFSHPMVLTKLVLCHGILGNHWMEKQGTIGFQARTIVLNYQGKEMKLRTVTPPANCKNQPVIMSIIGKFV